MLKGTGLVAGKCVCSWFILTQLHCIKVGAVNRSVSAEHFVSGIQEVLCCAFILSVSCGSAALLA